MPDIKHGPRNGLEHALGDVSTPCQGVGATTGPDGLGTQMAHELRNDTQNPVHREASHSISEIQAARERCLVELRAKHKVARREYEEAKAAWGAQNSTARLHSQKISAAHQDVYGRLLSDVSGAQRIINTLDGLTPQQYLDVRTQALEEGRRVLAELEAAYPQHKAIDINSLSKREHLSYLIQQLETLL